MKFFPSLKEEEEERGEVIKSSRRRERRDAALGLERRRRGVDLGQPRAQPAGQVGDLREREHARGDPGDLFRKSFCFFV